MPVTPKSVAYMNKHPYMFSRFSLGTRFNEWVTLLRNLHDILTEKCDFQLLGNPTVIQNTGAGGTTKQMEISAAFDYTINGVVYTKAATEDIDVSASATTGAGEYKAMTLSIDASQVVTQTVSDVAAAAPVTPPAVPSGDCPFATVQIPASFTAGTTDFETSWVTNGWTAQQDITASKPAALPDVDS